MMFKKRFTCLSGNDETDFWPDEVFQHHLLVHGYAGVP